MNKQSSTVLQEKQPRGEVLTAWVTDRVDSVSSILCMNSHEDGFIHSGQQFVCMCVWFLFRFLLCV